ERLHYRGSKIMSCSTHGKPLVVSAASFATPAASGWCHHSGRQAATDHEEPRVTDHPVIGSDRQGVNVPGAHDRFAARGLGETTMRTKCFCSIRKLGCRRDVRA